LLSKTGNALVRFNWCPEFCSCIYCCRSQLFLYPEKLQLEKYQGGSITISSDRRVERSQEMIKTLLDGQELKDMSIYLVVFCKAF
jgi:hypothetical protein